MTHYEVLGLSQEATFVEIRHNYRQLVKQYHPDLNPSPEARELIVKITEAYEVLSDPFKKQAYDWQLLGYQAQEAAPPAPQYDEREIRRRDYIRRKREQEQHNWEKLFHWKVKFYKMQRVFAIFFILVGLVYSYDYFFTEVRHEYPIEMIIINNNGESKVSLGYFKFTSDSKLYDEVRLHQVENLQLHYSWLHNTPVGVSAPAIGYYRIHGTVHSFGNFFAYLLFGLSFVLIWNHQYSDWSLTLGLLPFFVTAFLLLLTYTTIRGIY